MKLEPAHTLQCWEGSVCSVVNQNNNGRELTVTQRMVYEALLHAASYPTPRNPREAAISKTKRMVYEALLHVAYYPTPQNPREVAISKTTHAVSWIRSWNQKRMLMEKLVCS